MLNVPSKLHGRVEATGMDDSHWMVYMTFPLEQDGILSMTRPGNVW